MRSRTPARTDCRGGSGRERRCLGTGVFGQVSLAGNRMASVAFGKPRFFWQEITLTFVGFYAQSKPFYLNDLR